MRNTFLETLLNFKALKQEIKYLSEKNNHLSKRKIDNCIASIIYAKHEEGYKACKEENILLKERIINLTASLEILKSKEADE